MSRIVRKLVFCVSDQIGQKAVFAALKASTADQQICFH